MYDLRGLKSMYDSGDRMGLARAGEDPDVLCTAGGKAAVKAYLSALDAADKAARAEARALAAVQGRPVASGRGSRGGTYQGCATLGDGDRAAAVLLAARGTALVYDLGETTARQESRYWTTDNVLRILASYYQAMGEDVPETIKLARGALVRWDDDARPTCGTAPATIDYAPEHDDSSDDLAHDDASPALAQ